LLKVAFASCMLIMLLPFSGRGQENPFELAPRLERPVSEDSIAEEAAQTVEEESGNPFDLRYTPPPARREATRPALEETAERAPTRFRRIKLFIILGILVLLSFLITVLRSLVNKSFQAFVNDNVMNQLYRDQEGRGLSPFLALYGLFFLNAGVFLFFLLQYYDINTNLNYLPLLLGCVALITGVFVFKHALLRFLSYTFPIEKEISRYQFTIIVFGIVTGLFLVPVNVFMAYASEELLPGIIWMAYIVFAVIYLFRYLRSLIIANKFIRFHFFHFFLYFCTVEIAPALFLLKFILNQLQ